MVDGTAAFAAPLSCAGGATESEDAITPTAALGFVWLFNPAYANATATIMLNDELVPATPGSTFCGSEFAIRVGAEYAITRLYPRDGTPTLHAKFGDSISIALDGSSAVMLQVSLSSSSRGTHTPHLVGLSADRVRWSQGVLAIEGAEGSYGSLVHGATVELPAELRSSCATTVLLNGVSLRAVVCSLRDSGAVTHTLPPLRFGGAHAARFPHAAAVPVTCPPGAHTGTCRALPDGNVSYTGWTAVPDAVFAQLAAREKAYPIKWDARDDDASWLRPHRLLLFLQLNCTTGRAGACDDKMFASLAVTTDGGKRVVPRALKAYESRCVECTNVNHPFAPRKSARFNGYYWDVSTVMEPNKRAHIELLVPSAYVSAVQGLYYEGVESIVTRDFELMI